MKTLIRAGLLGLALVAAPATIALAQATPSAPAADTLFRATTLNLSAYGETRVAPDMATINLGVLVEAKSASAAMAANAQRMTQVLAALKAAGIADAVRLSQPDRLIRGPLSPLSSTSWPSKCERSR